MYMACYKNNQKDLKSISVDCDLNYFKVSRDSSVHFVIEERGTLSAFYEGGS